MKCIDKIDRSSQKKQGLNLEDFGGRPHFVDMLFQHISV